MKTELLDAYLCGELDPIQEAQVRFALERDESLREVYFKQVKMDAALKVLLGGRAEVGRIEFTQGVLARLRMEAAGAATEEPCHRDFSRSVLSEILEEKEKIIPLRRNPLRWPDLVKSAVCAAVAALAVLLGFREIILEPSRQTSPPGSFSIGTRGKQPVGYFARIESSNKAVWAGANNELQSEPLREDGWISNGYIHLKSGVAEIAFNSGARAFVEGPTQLSVESNNRIFLKQGKMTAEVNKRSAGFTVNTPQLNVVDLGTRFGVSVSESGETEVHVMEGVVEASRAQGNSATVELHEGLALRADNRPLSSLSPIPYAGDEFTLTINPGDGLASWQDPLPMIHYAFDESGGAEIFDTGNSRSGSPHDINLLDKESGGIFDNLPRRAPGREGRCLVFGPNQKIATSIDGNVQLSDPFTLCFWMKIPPKVRRSVDDYMVGWGREGEGWELGCTQANHNGALVVRIGGRQVVGSTDIADGKWHHIAVRFLGGKSVSPAAHLHLYIDGVLEPVTGSWEMTSISGPVGELRIGDLENSGFPGWVDQVSIFDQAISTQAIQRFVAK